MPLFFEQDWRRLSHLLFYEVVLYSGTFNNITQVYLRSMLRMSWVRTTIMVSFVSLDRIQVTIANAMATLTLDETAKGMGVVRAGAA
jgi:hypothetical protein